MSTSTTPPTPPAPTPESTPPVPSTEAAPPPAPFPGATAEVVSSVEAAAGQAEAVVSDLHQTAEQFKQEWDAASPQTKDAFHALLRDASILRGEAFIAFKKLIGHLK